MTVQIPEGFAPYDLPSRYVLALGSLYADRDGRRLGLAAHEGLANIAGVAHGGALVTLADVALFFLGGDGIPLGGAVTLTLNSSFVAPARLPSFLVAQGRLVKAGRSVRFVEGEIVDHADGEPRLTFSGTLKLVRREGLPLSGDRGGSA